MQATQERKTSWLDRPLLTSITLNWEVVIFGVILVLFIVTRFYNLDDRVMSHDESLHTYYSWLLYQGQGFQHTPLMHGPLQFHLIAFSYFLFGDSDFTARIPAVLGSIASLLLLWNFRRYLGRAGTLIAGALFLISPYLLYYGRYVRNEALIVPLGLATIWAILRYLEKGEPKYLYLLTAATVLHFTAKETSFIYTAQALLFLGLFFIHRITRRAWPHAEFRRTFLIFLILAFVLAGGALGSVLFSRSLGTLSGSETVAPSVPGEEAFTVSGVPSAITIALVIFALIAILVSLYLLIRGYGWPLIRAERSFDLIVLLGTLVLPQLAPFAVRGFGWDPLDYSGSGMIRTSLILAPILIASIAAGLWWRARLWLINAAIFYAVFVVFYTTIFTNGGGFFTGMVGSLGYWLDQQGVRRGSQPFYYYLLIQVPIYEYVPALGALLALYYGIRDRAWRALFAPTVQTDLTEEVPQKSGAPALGLVSFWAVTSIAAYTLAGEKMPWLTVHIAWPLILLSGWSLGRLVQSIDWLTFRQRRGVVLILLLMVFFSSLTAVLITLLGSNPPFQGSELTQLQATSTFLTAFLTTVLSGAILFNMLKSWQVSQFIRLAGLTLFGLLSLLTARTAFVASYINQDNATEYLVYAHGARGVKDVMDQVQDISRRTTDGLALEVAYDDDVSWPFTWYLRNYTRQRYYANNPTRDLRDLPVVIVGDSNFSSVEPILGQAFYRFDYIRMVWPDQDYFNLTWERILDAIQDPQMRLALFQIWLNRDYALYTELVNKDLSLENWNPSDRMRMYVRKDVATKLWNYGVGPAPEEVVADPYENGKIDLAADRIVGGEGSEPGQFLAPRGMAAAPDGTIYVADSRNHRIQHLAADGSVLHVWGTFGEPIGSNAAAPGTFNEPWGVAVGPDGSVYVADTWNHRVQKFTAEGEFISTWGYFGQAEDAFALWGPRDVTVDDLGRVLVTDTGNKRVIAYDETGNFVAEIGGPGFAPGKFDEPTGIAAGANNFIFVADTWNQRIQALTLDPSGALLPFTTWDISGWYGQSLDNKPYIAAGLDDRVFVSDPEGFRILEFAAEGQFIRYWGEFGAETGGFSLPTGLAIDPDGGIWVSDAGSHQILHFTFDSG